MRYEAVLTEQAHEEASNLLLKSARNDEPQEDLCFALWRPSSGETRTTALIFHIISPLEGERHCHGNVSFEPSFLTRSIRLACSMKAGLAFMHSHLTDGWQSMSKLDEVAERDRISPPTRATGLPLVGLTIGTDESWSARFWIRDGSRFERSWCEKVRVVGRRLRVTFNDTMLPPPKRREILRRTIDSWGDKCQHDLSRLRIGVVGVGSVGSIVAEALARIGIRKLVLIDADKIETHNLDRLIYAGRKDIGKYKVDLAARNLKNNATAENFEVQTYRGWIQQENVLLMALDCDVIFAAVDRPLPKDLLNRIAYVHCIPVISGGVFIDNKPNGTLGQAAWSVTSMGPMRRCLRCDGQYSTSEVVMELDGSFDNPSYISQIGETNGNIRSNQNVFPFSVNLASFMVIEMLRLVVADDWWPDTGGKLHYSMVPNQLRRQNEVCKVNCTINESLALGDQYCYPHVQKPPRETKQPILEKTLSCFKQWIAKLSLRN